MLVSEFASKVADMKNSVKDRSNAQASCAGHFIESHIDKEYAGDWVSVMSASRSAPFPSHLFSSSATSVCVLAGTRRHGRPRFLKRKGNGLWCGADSRFIGGCRVLLAFSFPLIPQWLFNQKAMLVKPFHHKDLPSDDIANNLVRMLWLLESGHNLCRHCSELNV